ncbi:MAG TPA: hypothetical protein VN924_00435 [Bryobacteraceae bacterium]|nr:hypothetical protein [Bryobacteraceae bacterium]
MRLLPAGVAIWTTDGGGVKVRWAEAPVEKLRSTSEEFLALCASPASNASEIRRLGNQLYRAFVQGVDAPWPAATAHEKDAHKGASGRPERPSLAKGLPHTHSYY